MTRSLLRLIALLVPHAARPRWREEWLAETGEIARVRGRLARLRAVTGAIPDAVAMRQLATGSARGRRPRPFRGTSEDVKYAGRSLVKSRAFALSVAGSLSLGIAAMIVQTGMYGVKGLDRPSLAGSFLLLAAAMLLASAVPAYRASRVDPITVLREE